MALRDQPYIPLYVQDFLSDEKLRECSAESVGVYIFLMCIMHKSEEYGKITLAPKYFAQANIKQDSEFACGFAKMLARQMPFSTDVIERSLSELLSERVIQLDGHTIVQKRMVKDCEISHKRAIAGREGGKKRVDNLAKVCLSKKQAKVQANSEIENENAIEDVNENEDVNVNDIEVKKGLDSMKKEYAENVTLTQKQYDDSIEKYGEQKTMGMIEILSNYKCSSGKKYKSDFHTFGSWVSERYDNERTKKKTGKQFEEREYKESDIEDLYMKV